MEYKISFGKDETAIIKSVAVSLMFIHHLFLDPEGIDYCNQEFFYNLSAIGKICVSIYSFITGYGIYYSYEKNNSCGAVKRVSRLYIRYWIILLLFYLPMQVIAGDFSFTLDTAFDYAINITGFQTSLNPTSWFLRNWVVFIITAPWLFKVMKKISNIAVELLLFVAVPIAISLIWNNYFLVTTIPDVLYYTVNEVLFSIMVYTPFFTVGSIIAKYKLFDKLFSWLQKNVGKWLLATLSIVVLLFMYIIPINRVYIYGMYYSYLIATPIFIVALVVLINTLNLKSVNKAMGFLGKHSSNMWLVHGAFYLGVFRPILYSVRYPLLILLFLTVISLIASIVTEKLVNLIDNKLIKANKGKNKVLYTGN